eukprot:6033819-Pyramimonas_sp.AAC.1
MDKSIPRTFGHVALRPVPPVGAGPPIAELGGCQKVPLARGAPKLCAPSWSPWGPLGLVSGALEA